MTWNTLQPDIRTQLERRLTPRQHDVLLLWLAGCTYGRIAVMLGISERTVRTHLKRAKQIHAELHQEAA